MEIGKCSIILLSITELLTRIKHGNREKFYYDLVWSTNVTKLIWVRVRVTVGVGVRDIVSA